MLARVSTPTVSRALRDSPLVTAETKALVLEIARKHGYAVNRNAQKLRDKRTNTIAVVADFKSFPGSRLADPFSFELLADVAQALSMRSQDLLLCGPADETCATYQTMLASKHADGIIFLGQGQRDPLLRELAQTDAAFVVWGAMAEDQPYCTVGGANSRGGEMVGARFAESKRSRAVFIGGSDQHLEMKQRRIGFEKAFRARRPEAKVEQVVVSDFSFESAYAAMATYLENRKKSDYPDAVFAASDTIAMAVYKALRNHELDIPGDVAVIGYNDNPHAAWCSPSLTTVRQDTRQAGALLVEQLMLILEGRKPQSIVIPAELIVRDSSES